MQKDKIYRAGSVGVLLNANEISSLIESIDVAVEVNKQRDLSLDETTLAKLRQKLTDMETIVYQG